MLIQMASKGYTRGKVRNSKTALCKARFGTVWLYVLESRRHTWQICVTNDHGYVPLVVNISRSFPHSWLITGFVTRLTRRVPLVEQELLTLPEHMSSPPIFSAVHVTRSLVFICMFCRSLFVLFLLAIVLFVLLRYTDSDYLFGIFKLFW